MKKLFYLFLGFLVASSVFGTNPTFPINQYKKEFLNAYAAYPDVPKGLLEGVSFTMTRFQHLGQGPESCAGLPRTYGVMGLTLDGKNYFDDNLKLISKISGISIDEILNSPEKNILAFAAAYSFYNRKSLKLDYKDEELRIALNLIQLSELPNATTQQNFAMSAHLYSVLSFMNNRSAQEKYGFPNHDFDLANVFGEENLQILSSPGIYITEGVVENQVGSPYKKPSALNKSADYGPALQNLTPCNYSSRNGTPISAVTLHTIQGSYAGAISWAHNCSVPSNVSYHYVLRSSDGQVTQVLLEKDKGWHVGSENPYTIGMEHEGYVNDSTWYTAAMYQSSADLVRDITQSGYGISPLRTAYFPWSSTTNYNVSSIPGSCIRIKGHQHYPNQTHTDPGSNWDWDYFYKLLNDPTTTLNSSNAQSGNVTDAGGAGNYTNDEHTYFLIQPTGASNITLTVNQFDIESNWDYLYLYNGTTVFDPLIGRYNGTNIPSTINVNGSSVLIEFRTDCATTGPGYDISWNASITTGMNEYEKKVLTVFPNPTQQDFTISFEQPAAGDLVVTDLAGKVVRKIILVNERTKTISLEGVSRGVYFVRYSNSVVKLIKE